MLTLNQINEASFSRAGFNGYKPGDVDDFIDEVVATVQQMTAALEAAKQEKEEAEKRAEKAAAQIAELEERNDDIQGKLAVLAEKIESYRSDEDGIKEVVLSAHKMAKSAVQQAKDEAKTILTEAESRSAEILEEAQSEYDAILSGARDESARKAKLYAEQVVAKKNELEQLKKQVSTFRSSLLELYRKHLEMINHIPNFRFKEESPASKQKEAAPSESRELLSADAEMEEESGQEI